MKKNVLLFLAMAIGCVAFSQTTCNIQISPTGVTSCGGSPVNLSTTHSVTGSDLSYDGPGSGEYVDVPSGSTLTSYTSQITISAWVNLPDASINQKIVSLLSNSLNDGFVLGIQNNGVYPELRDVNGTNHTFSNVGIVPNSTWTQIAMTYKASDSMRIYVNGVVVASQAAGTTNIASNTNGLAFGIASWDRQSFATTGEIDEIRMYSVALTPAQMAATYNLSLPGTAPGLIGYWRFDDGSGATASDATGNGNDGTVYNSPAWITPNNIPLIYPVTYLWTPMAGLTTSTSSSTTATVSQSTTYHVTLTDTSTGCVATDTVRISIGGTARPTSVSASSANVCHGDSVTLSGSGFISLMWSPGTQSGRTIEVAPTTPTAYIATGTDSSGCQHIDTVRVGESNITSLATASAGDICHGDTVSLTVTGLTTHLWSPGGQTTATVHVAPAAATTYIVTGVDSGACHHSDTVTVSLYSIPTVTAMASASTVCAGDTVTITASGLTSYTWSPGSVHTAAIAVAPAAATTYTVTGTDANGCHGIDTISIHVGTPPAVPTITTTGATLSASAATSYQWYRNGVAISGATGQTYQPNQSGTYTVEVANAAGCKSISAGMLVTGINDMTTDSKVSVYPNPTSNEIHITVTNGDDYTVSVYDVMGREIMTVQSGQAETMINLAALSSGSYLIQIKGATINALKQIIKN